MPNRASARPEGRTGTVAGLSWNRSAARSVLAGAGLLRLTLGLTRLAVAFRATRAGPGLVGRFAGGGPASGVRGDLGLDVGQRVLGVLGEPGQVAGGQRDAVAGPVPALSGLPGLHVAGAMFGGA